MNESRHQCYCVVVCCCVRTYGTWCLVFGDTLFLTLDLKVCVCLCVCVCVCLFPARVLVFLFLRKFALSSRALLFAVDIFWLAVLFHVRLRAGPARAGSAPGSPLCSSLPCVPGAARGCRGLHVRRAWRSLFFLGRLERTGGWSLFFLGRLERTMAQDAHCFL